MARMARWWFQHRRIVVGDDNLTLAGCAVTTPDNGLVTSGPSWEREVAASNQR